jgi:hypothetical protein
LFRSHGPKQRLHQFKRQFMSSSMSFRHLYCLREVDEGTVSRSCFSIHPETPLLHLAGVRVESLQATAVALASTPAGLAFAIPALTSPTPIAPSAVPLATPLHPCSPVLLCLPRASDSRSVIAFAPSHAQPQAFDPRTQPASCRLRSWGSRDRASTYSGLGVLTMLTLVEFLTR